MKTIIAEKPSVAREIARIVGATKREEGYFEGGGYAVTWAFGHLVQLAMPDGYGVRGLDVYKRQPSGCTSARYGRWCSSPSTTSG